MIAAIELRRNEIRCGPLLRLASAVPVHFFRAALFGLLMFGMSFAPGYAAATTASNSAPTLATANVVSPANGASGTSNPQPDGEPKRHESATNSKSNSPEGIDELEYLRSPMVHTVARWIHLPVDASSRLFELINFGLVWVAIIWFAAKKLPKILRQRRERLRAELEQARASIESANRRLAAVEERLSRLDSEIEAIRTQAEEETRVEEQRLRAAMEQEKQSILHMASEDIHAATRNMQNQLRRLAADLTIEHAARQISITAEIDRSIVDGFLHDLSRKSPQTREDA